MSTPYRAKALDAYFPTVWKEVATNFFSGSRTSCPFPPNDDPSTYSDVLEASTYSIGPDYSSFFFRFW